MSDSYDAATYSFLSGLCYDYSVSRLHPFTGYIFLSVPCYYIALSLYEYSAHNNTMDVLHAVLLRWKKFFIFFSRIDRYTGLELVMLVCLSC